MQGLLDRELTLHLNSLVILLGVAMGLGLAFYMWCHAAAGKAARLCLGLMMAVVGVLALTYVLRRESQGLGLVLLTLTSLQMALGPLLYLYTRILTQEGFRWQRHQLWHFLPVLLLGLLWLGQLPLAEDGVLTLSCAASGPCDLLNQSRFVHRAFTWMSLLAYGWWSLTLLKPYGERIRACYSDIEGINLAWLQLLVRSFLGLTVLAMAMELGHHLGLPLDLNGAQLQAWGPLLWSVLIVHYGLRQQGASKGSTPDAPAAQAEPRKYQTSSLTKSDAGQLWERLQRLMVKEAPYLEHGLKISELAARLDVPPHHLSETINGLAGQSFYDYINQFRLDQALRLLADPVFGHLSVTEVGFEAGFNSNSTFFAHFKKRYNQTPSAYRRQLQPAEAG